MTLLLLLAAVALVAQTESPDAEKVELTNETDSLSYFLGLTLGYDLQTLPFEANQELILKGFTQVFSGNAPYDQPSTQEVFTKLQTSLRQKEQKKADLEAHTAIEKGNDFLAENLTREGVVATASGLQYEVITMGDGAMPADTSRVKVHYEGTLMDGTKFDSSYDRGEPITFALNGVIPGWTEGVQLMPVGSTFRFYIPSALGYGPRGTGPIPPNSVLIFKIELLGIE